MEDHDRVPDGVYERRFRGRYMGTITAGNGVKLVEFTTDWPAPHKANMSAAVDGPTRYSLVADALAAGSLDQLRVGDEIRLTVAEHFEQGRRLARWQSVFGVDAVEPLPAVTDDEIGWVLTTIGVLGEGEPTAKAEIPGMRHKLMGCCDRDAIVDGLVSWVGEDERAAIGQRVDVVLGVLGEVGYVVGVRDEDLPLEHNAVGVSAEGLVTLTYEGHSRAVDFNDTLDVRHLRLLGPPADDERGASYWEGSAARIDAYRLVHRIEDPQGLGEITGDHAARLDRAAVERTIADARRETGYERGAESPDALPVVLVRGTLVEIDNENYDEPGMTIETPWGAPPGGELVSERHYWLPAPNSTRFGEGLRIGGEVRIAVGRVAGADQAIAVEAAEPLPHVTADELGWTLSTIVDCGQRAQESGRHGVATTDEVAAAIASWSDPDGLSSVEARARAAIKVAVEVGYAVSAYSHELDPTISEADTQRLIVLTDSGREACIAWEDAHTARNVALLGERPAERGKARAWDIAATRVDSYRLRYGIEDPRGLGEQPDDRRESIDRAQVERAIATAGRFIEPPSLGPDLGIGR